MTKIAAKPVRFKAPVSIGEDEYTAHLNQAEWQSTQPTSSFTDLDGKTTQFGGESAWVLALGGAQDWVTVNALSQFMLEHEGEEVEVTVGLPGGGTAVGTVIMAAPNIGGTANSPMTFQKTLPAKGKPVVTPGVPT